MSKRKAPTTAIYSIKEVAKIVNRPAAEIEAWCATEDARRHGAHMIEGEWKIFPLTLEYGWPPLALPPSRPVAPPSPLEEFYGAADGILRLLRTLADHPKTKIESSGLLRRFYSAFDAAYPAAIKAGKRDVAADILSLSSLLGGRQGAGYRLQFMASEHGGDDFALLCAPIRRHLAVERVDASPDKPTEIGQSKEPVWSKPMQKKIIADALGFTVKQLTAQGEKGTYTLRENNRKLFQIDLRNLPRDQYPGLH
jgi:hypothetical protein